MSPPGFVASEFELELADMILDATKTWRRNDSLSVDTAIRIFHESGISFKQMRDIWSLADENDTGYLSKDELVVAIRLLGWVQAGNELHEALLAQVGPLFTLGGIDKKPVPKSTPVELHVNVPGYRESSQPSVATRPGLDVKTSGTTIDLPSSQPLADSQDWEMPCLSEDIELRITRFKLDLEKNGYLKGNSMIELTSSLNLPLRELAHIWNFANQRNNSRLSANDITLGIRLTREWLAKKFTTTPRILSPVSEENRGVAADMKSQFISQPSDTPATCRSLPPYGPSPVHHNPSGEAPTRVVDIQHRITLENFRRSAERLSIDTKSMIQRQIEQKKEIQVANTHLKERVAALESQLHVLHDALSKSIPIDIYTLRQKQYTEELNRLRHEKEEWEDKLRDSRAETLAAQNDADNVRMTLEVQSQELVDTKQCLFEAERAAQELSYAPDNPNLRFIYLRASLRQSQDEAAKAKEKIKELQRTIDSQQSTISTLRLQAANSECDNGTLQLSALPSLDTHHEGDTNISNLAQVVGDTSTHLQSPGSVSFSPMNTPLMHSFGSSDATSLHLARPLDPNLPPTENSPQTVITQLPSASRSSVSATTTNIVSSGPWQLDEYDNYIWEQINGEITRLEQALESLPDTAPSTNDYLHRPPSSANAEQEYSLQTATQEQSTQDDPIVSHESTGLSPHTSIHRLPSYEEAFSYT